SFVARDRQADIAAQDKRERVPSGPVYGVRRMRHFDRSAEFATLFATVATASPATRAPVWQREHAAPRKAIGLLRRALETIRLWQRRAEGRQQLRSFDDHLLSDIGITRLQAEAEADKPFWRA